MSWSAVKSANGVIRSRRVVGNRSRVAPRNVVPFFAAIQ